MLFRKTILKLFNLSIGIFCFGTMLSQVTVGSSITPNPGALLDLKEQNPSSNNSNSKRGLSLPRVKLTDKFNLYPMFEDTSSPGNPNSDYTGTKKPDEDAKHIGLLVYNLNKCDGFGRGTYVWEGTEWQPMPDVRNILQQPSISLNINQNFEKIDDNTYLVHIPSGRDLRTFPSDNKFKLSFDWTDPSSGNLSRTAITELSTTPVGSDGGLKFLNSTQPANWTTPITSSPVSFDYELQDMTTLIPSDNANTSDPYKSRETSITFEAPANECYPAKQITVR